MNDDLAKGYAGWRPAFYTWQLTEDRQKLIDSMSGEAVDLPPQPHGPLCKCAFCERE